MVDNDNAKKLPKNIEEFLEQQNLEEWPQRLSSEGCLLMDVDSVLGSKEDIKDSLKSAAPLRLDILDDLESRLHNMETQLYQYSSLTLTDDVRTGSKMRNNTFHIPKKVDIMKRSGDGIAVFRNELERKQKRKAFAGEGDSNSKSVDSIHFPGFYSQEMLELPGIYEAPILMNAVTLRQSFNPGFMKFWKLIFLSEASVAIMQDMFWWVFLDRFESRHAARSGKNDELSSYNMNEEQIRLAKDKLFNRIADSFVNMFFSINPDMKDKFLNVYPDCLAQTLFASYSECFPISKLLFDEHFKAYVANLCSQWISGVKPNPAQIREWNLDKLMAKDASEEPHKNPGKEKDSFDKWGGSHKQNITRGKGGSHAKSTYKQTSMPAVGADEMERLPFSVYGRSPLIAHWLHSKSMEGKSQQTTTNQKMVRMQVEKVVDPQALTFADVIAEVKENEVVRHKEVTRIEKETKREMRRIDENLKTQLATLKNLERKLAKETLPSAPSASLSAVSKANQE